MDSPSGCAVCGRRAEAGGCGAGCDLPAFLPTLSPSSGCSSFSGRFRAFAFLAGQHFCFLLHSLRNCFKLFSASFQALGHFSGQEHHVFIRWHLVLGFGDAILFCCCIFPQSWVSLDQFISLKLFPHSVFGLLLSIRSHLFSIFQEYLKISC